MKSIVALLIVSIIASTLAIGAGVLPKTPSPKGAKAYIISPKDGDTVKSPVRVLFGLAGMGVAPAGVDIPDTGHHHLIIDLDELPSLEVPLPATENVVHFGKGQTEVEIELTKGEHTLQLLLGDFRHIPHDPPIFSKKITVKVN